MVDDSEISLDLMSQLLIEEGHSVAQAHSATEALRLVGESPLDVVVCDLHMPELDGFDMLEQLRDLDADLPVIYASVDDSPESVLQALRLRVFGYVLKEGDSCRLLPPVVRQALAHVRVKRWNRELTLQLRQANEQLEQRVVQRTAQLECAVHKLEEQECNLRLTLKQLEESREQSLLKERLAALGMLAASVAHDINNPASYVMAHLRAAQQNLQTLRKHLDIPAYPGRISTSEPPTLATATIESGKMLPYTMDQTELLLSECLTGLDRILATAQDINQFARPLSPVHELLDLNMVIRSACHLMSNQIRHRANLELDLNQTVPVTGMESRLAQVFVNLLSNAAYAITEGSREINRIRVSTELSPTHVIARVQDTGCGISAEQLALIQDPFYTTKPKNQGTGLGLTLCSRVVSEHKGQIEFESQIDEGTCVKITLPRASTKTEIQHSFVPEENLCEKVLKGLRILVVDDEVELLRALRRQLRTTNEVVVATGGEAAFGILEQDSAFDLIVCDLMMPDVDGPVVYETIKQRWPLLAQRIIFVSGGTFTQRTREFVETVTLPLLTKPFSLAKLSKAIAQLHLS